MSRMISWSALDSRLALEMNRAIVVLFCRTSSVSAYRAAVPGIRVYPGARPGWGPEPGAGPGPDSGCDNERNRYPGWWVSAYRARLTGRQRGTTAVGGTGTDPALDPGAGRGLGRAP